MDPNAASPDARMDVIVRRVCANIIADKIYDIDYEEVQELDDLMDQMKQKEGHMAKLGDFTKTPTEELREIWDSIENISGKPGELEGWQVVDFCVKIFDKEKFKKLFGR